MTWVKLDDSFPDHPKMLRVGDKAFRFYITALCWCSRQLTDGFLPSRFGGRPADLLELRKAGLLEEVEGGHQIHDYLDYNPSRDEVLNQRASQREQRVAAGKARAAGAQRVAGRFAGGSHQQNTSPDPAPAPTRISPTPTPTPKSLAQAEPERFREFWDVYPRKQGKIAAKKAYRDAVRLVGADVLISAAMRFADDPNRDEEYTPHPATWLHQGRWDDDPLPSPDLRSRHPLDRIMTTALEAIHDRP